MQKSNVLNFGLVNFLSNMWKGNIVSWKAFSLAWAIGLAIIVSSLAITAVLANVNFLLGLIAYTWTVLVIALHTFFICISIWRAFSRSNMLVKALIVFYAIGVLRVLVFIPPPGIVPGT